MAGSVVGIDIGANVLRGVEVMNFDTAKPTIVRLNKVPLPENSVRRGEVVEVATVSTAIKRLWSTAGFRSKKAVLGVGGQRVFARDLSVPRAPIEQIRESLPFQVQELLPVPVSDVLMDFYPVAEETGEQGPTVSGLLVAGLKYAIDVNVQAVMHAGLQPVHVDLIPFALCRAVAPVRSARGRDVIVAIGAATTNVIVVDNGVPKFVRIIPNGGDDITTAIASRLQWSPEQAESAKRAVGMSRQVIRQEDRPIIEIIYEVAGELLGSIRNTLSYYANAHPNEPVQRVMLTGGGALLQGLPNALADLTRLPVALAESVSALPVPRQIAAMGKEELDLYAVAYGLALGSHE